jgi:capsule polysaccharide export protein KpsC/LpsZ
MQRRKNATQNSLFYNGIKIYYKMKKRSEFETILNLKEFQEKCLNYVKIEFKIE